MYDIPKESILKENDLSDEALKLGQVLKLNLAKAKPKSNSEQTALSTKGNEEPVVKTIDDALKACYNLIERERKRLLPHDI